MSEPKLSSFRQGVLTFYNDQGPWRERNEKKKKSAAITHKISVQFVTLQNIRFRKDIRKYLRKKSYF